MVKRSEIKFSNNQEIRQLQEFVLELAEILEDVVYNPRLVIPGRHHKRLKTVWEDIAISNSETAEDVISEFIQNLEGLSKPFIREDGTPALAMTKGNNVGLAGAQLAFDLGVWSHVRDDYLDYGTAKQGQSEPKSFFPRLRKNLSRVLKVANTILGSAASELPMGEFLKEFVDQLGLLVELTGDFEELFQAE